MLVLSLLPLLAGFFLFVIFWQTNKSETVYRRIRIAFLNATLSNSLFLVFNTELLSVFKSLTPFWVLITWSSLTVILFIFLLRSGALPTTLRSVNAAAWKAWRESWILKLISVLLLISFIIAVIYPPNNYDSLTYHMARVAHWVQNKSISHYQTHIIRQLIFPPFAEWSILHVQLLTGSDRLANAVQLFFFGGCILVVSLLISELGGNRKQQLLGALLTATIPMAIIQSNTTQNDIVVAFFVLCFVYRMLRLLKDFSYSNIFLAGITLGLALLTKGTAYLFTVLFFAWVVVIFIRSFRQPLQLLRKVVLVLPILLLAILINYGHYYRNTFLTDKPLGDANKDMTNEPISFKPLLLVAVKNYMNHLPAGPRLKSMATKVADSWQIDINDPRYSYNNLSWMHEKLTFHEDYAQNFFHALLIVFVGLSFLSRRNLYRKPVNYYVLFVATVYASALLFSFLLKWQPWSNRLETSLFMLFCVFFGIEIGNWKKWIQLVCLVPLTVYGMAALLYSNRHPVLPLKYSILNHSYNSLFYFRTGLFTCMDYINGTKYTKIGLYLGPDSPDYPYYKLLQQNTDLPRQMKHLFVTNESAIYLDNFVPDIIISQETGRSSYTIRGRTYLKTKIFGEGPAVFEMNPHQ